MSKNKDDVDLDKELIKQLFGTDKVPDKTLLERVKENPANKEALEEFEREYKRVREAEFGVGCDDDEEKI